MCNAKVLCSSFEILHSFVELWAIRSFARKHSSWESWNSVCDLGRMPLNALFVEVTVSEILIVIDLDFECESGWFGVSKGYFKTAPSSRILKSRPMQYKTVPDESDSERLNVGNIPYLHPRCEELNWHITNIVVPIYKQILKNWWHDSSAQIRRVNGVCSPNSAFQERVLAIQQSPLLDGHNCAMFTKNATFVSSSDNLEFVVEKSWNCKCNSKVYSSSFFLLNKI